MSLESFEGEFERAESLEGGFGILRGAASDPPDAKHELEKHMEMLEEKEKEVNQLRKLLLNVENDVRKAQNYRAAKRLNSRRGVQNSERFSRMRTGELEVIIVLLLETPPLRRPSSTSYCCIKGSSLFAF
jgi:hypothetical protein